MADNPSQAQLNIKVSEELEEGRPVNFFQMGHNPYEFYLDLGMSVPNIPNGFKILFRGVMSPARVKELHSILGAQIEQYEKNFKKIEMVKPQGTPLQGTSDVTTSYIG
jgi:hypothetical protein